MYKQWNTKYVLNTRAEWINRENTPRCFEAIEWKLKYVYSLVKILASKTFATGETGQSQPFPLARPQTSVTSGNNEITRVNGIPVYAILTIDSSPSPLNDDNNDKRYGDDHCQTKQNVIKIQHGLLHGCDYDRWLIDNRFWFFFFLVEKKSIELKD